VSLTSSRAQYTTCSGVRSAHCIAYFIHISGRVPTAAARGRPFGRRPRRWPSEAKMERVVGLVNKLQQICTQLGDTAGNSILVDKLSSIVVVGGQVRLRHSARAALVGARVPACLSA
jgi:hypothetical protein